MIQLPESADSSDFTDLKHVMVDIYYNVSVSLHNGLWLRCTGSESTAILIAGRHRGGFIHVSNMLFGGI